MLGPAIVHVGDGVLECFSGGGSRCAIFVGEFEVAHPGTDSHAYAPVAGVVAGGGLTVNANAPYPTGVGILLDAKVFEDEGISPLGLFLGALLPTTIAIAFFWLLH